MRFGVLALFTLILGAQEQRTVTVRVVDAQTGAPLARVLVEYPAAQSSMLTGESGEVTIPIGKQPGPRVVRVSRPGYEAQAKVPDGPQLTLKLFKQATVRGRVTDRFQEPVPGLRVEVVHHSVIDGYRQTGVTTWCETNDLGEYSFAELSKGKQEFRVGGRTGQVFFVGTRPQESRVTERYKNVTASLILEAGDVRELPFQVEMEPAFSVKGRVEGYTRSSIPKLELLGGDGLPAGARFAMNFETGAFEWSDVAAGEYKLVATGPTGENGNSRRAEMAVTVAKENLTGLQVALGDPVAAEVNIQGCEQIKQGMIVFRPAGLAGVLQPGEVTATIERRSVQEPVRLPPGRYQIEAHLSGVCAVSAVRAGDQDVLAQGLRVDPASGPLKVSVALQAAAVIQVKLPEKERLTVMALPANSGGLWIAPAEGVSEMATLSGLPPGEYIVAAWKMDPDLAYREEDVQERMRRTGVRVTLSAGQTADVEIRELVQ